LCAFRDEIIVDIVGGRRRMTTRSIQHIEVHAAGRRFSWRLVGSNGSKLIFETQAESGEPGRLLATLLDILNRP
jgi:hypothetical protein